MHDLVEKSNCWQRMRVTGSLVLQCQSASSESVVSSRIPSKHPQISNWMDRGVLWIQTWILLGLVQLVICGCFDAFCWRDVYSRHFLSTIPRPPAPELESILGAHSSILGAHSKTCILLRHYHNRIVLVFQSPWKKRVPETRVSKTRVSKTRVYESPVWLEADRSLAAGPTQQVAQSKICIAFLGWG